MQTKQNPFVELEKRYRHVSRWYGYPSPGLAVNLLSTH